MHVYIEDVGSTRICRKLVRAPLKACCRCSRNLANLVPFHVNALSVGLERAEDVFVERLRTAPTKTCVVTIHTPALENTLPGAPISSPVGHEAPFF
jgi:hypothetical protein